MAVGKRSGRRPTKRSPKRRHSGTAVVSGSIAEPDRWPDFGGGHDAAKHPLYLCRLWDAGDPGDGHVVARLGGSSDYLAIPSTRATGADRSEQCGSYAALSDLMTYNDNQVLYRTIAEIKAQITDPSILASEICFIGAWAATQLVLRDPRGFQSTSLRSFLEQMVTELHERLPENTPYLSNHLSCEIELMAHLTNYLISDGDDDHQDRVVDSVRNFLQLSDSLPARSGASVFLLKHEIDSARGAIATRGTLNATERAGLQVALRNCTDRVHPLLFLNCSYISQAMSIVESTTQFDASQLEQLVDLVWPTTWNRALAHALRLCVEPATVSRLQRVESLVAEVMSDPELPDVVLFQVSFALTDLMVGINAIETTNIKKAKQQNPRLHRIILDVAKFHLHVAQHAPPGSQAGEAWLQNTESILALTELGLSANVLYACLSQATTGLPVDEGLDEMIRRLHFDLLCRIHDVLDEQHYDIDSIKDEYEHLPEEGSYRLARLAMLGSACSSMMNFGDDDRLTIYWCAKLYCERVKLIELFTSPPQSAVSEVYENAAIALSHRSTFNHEQGKRELALRDLELARRYAAIAVDSVEDEFRRPRTVLTYSWLEYLAHRRYGSGNINKARRIQAQVLASASATNVDHVDLGGLAEMVFPVSASEDRAEFELVSQFYFAAMAESSHIRNVCDIAQRGAYCAQASNDERLAVQFLLGAIDQVRAIADLFDTNEGATPSVLASIDGFATQGAAMCLKSGDVEHAIEVLEGGTAIRARLIASSRYGSDPVGAPQVDPGLPVLYLFRDDDNLFGVYMRTQMDGSVEYRTVSAERLQQSGASLLHCVDASDTDEQGEDAPYSSESEVGVPSRGMRGIGDGPGEATALRTLSVARDVLTVCLEGIPPSVRVHLIPVGELARVPWHAAGVLLDQAPTITMSHSASVHAHRPTPDHAQQVKLAFGAPARVVVNGAQWPALHYALSEIDALARDYEFLPRVGELASLDEFESAIDAKRFAVLHIATHGMFDPTASDGPCLLWNATTDGDSPATFASQLSKVRADLVFLACCWGGTTTRWAPDEALGFTSTLLASGTGAVIAPLWPINDHEAKAFVEAFYVEYADLDWQDPAHALQLTAQRCKDGDEPVGLLTWSAFFIAVNPHRQ